jgi:hypothetical protein
MVLNCEMNYGSVPDWISALAGIITLIIGWRALSSWRQEKVFDLSMEMISKSRTATNLITYLRIAPVFEGED